MSSRLVSLIGSAPFKKAGPSADFEKVNGRRYLKEMLILNSFSFEEKDLRYTRPKPGLALRLISKGLFYIRAMGLTFLFSDLRWARSTYSFFFAMNDDIDEPSFLQSRPSSHTLHLVTFGCYNPHCVTWCHFCKKIEKKSV